MFARTLRGVLAATALVAAVSTATEAQQASKGLGVYGGIVLPMGDFGDVAELGFQLGGQFAIPMQGPLGMRFNGDFSRFGTSDDALFPGNFTLLGVMANLTYDIGTDTGFHPYLLGGLGFYNAKFEADGGGSVDESDLAFNIGAGYHFNAGNSRLFAEIRYVSIMTEGGATTMLPITFGIRF